MAPAPLHCHDGAAYTVVRVADSLFVSFPGALPAPPLYFALTLMGMDEWPNAAPLVPPPPNGVDDSELRPPTTRFNDVRRVLSSLPGCSCQGGRGYNCAQANVGVGLRPWAPAGMCGALSQCLCRACGAPALGPYRVCGAPTLGLCSVSGGPTEALRICGSVVSQVGGYGAPALGPWA